MKTLIIHPKDPSTQFLDIVYTPINEKTIITGGVSVGEIKALIEKHDRVMMMGHGSPMGLFSVGQFWGAWGYIIDHTMVDILQQKENNVFIWCFADKFVKRHNLKGFYSGMFISELGEAHYLGYNNVTQEIVDESNYGFCEILSNYINEDKTIIHENVLKEYGKIAETNPVAKYNYERLYIE